MQLKFLCEYVISGISVNFEERNKRPTPDSRFHNTARPLQFE